jgi:polysaccharide biosynthesis transport protein
MTQANQTGTATSRAQMLAAATEELDLRRLIAIMRRRALWILGMVVLMTGALFAKATSETSMYTATAELLLQSKNTEAINSGIENQNSSNASTAARTIATELRVIESTAISVNANKKLGYEAKVKASGVPDADIVRVTAVSENQARAAQIANTYAQEYIAFRKLGSVDDLISAAEKLDGQIVQLEQQISVLETKIAALPPDDAASRQTLDLTRVATVNQNTLLRNRAEALRLDASLRTGGARIINAAEVPTSPTSPKPGRSLILGLMLGLILGSGLAFAIDLLDDRIRSKEDLDALQLGLPVLGLIPKTKSFKRSETPELESFSASMSPAAEAYRTLRSAVQFAGIERDLKVLLVTSTDAAESKSTTAANLAVTVARSGASVCLVDADLRNPRLHAFFGVRPGVGLTDVLLGSERPPDVISAFAEIEGLGLMAAGRKSPNPAELLGSNRMSVLLGVLKKHFDLVIVDSPPILPVVDALELSRQVDGVLVATLIGRTKRRGLNHAVELLNNVNAPLLGIVMSGMDKAASYGYGYGYGYGETESRGRWSKAKKALQVGVPGLTAKPLSDTAQVPQFMPPTRAMSFPAQAAKSSETSDSPETPDTRDIEEILADELRDLDFPEPGTLPKTN